MFGMGIGEIVVIAIVALLFVGPEKLPDAAKKISAGIRDFRKHTRDLQKTIDQDTEIGSAVRELKSALRGLDVPNPVVVKPREPEPEVEPTEGAAEPATDSPPVLVDEATVAPSASAEGTPAIAPTTGAPESVAS